MSWGATQADSNTHDRRSGKDYMIEITESPLVSVIVITYNLGRYVGEAVESALAQTYRPIEIIVADDGSTDNTQQILASYQNRIKYIFQDHQGGAVARNTAIAASRGQYVALLDADDVWMPRKLAQQIDYLALHPKCALLATHAIPIDERSVHKSETPLYPWQQGGRVSFEEILLNSPLAASTLVAKRECLPHPFPFTPGRYYGDWEFCLRIALRHQVEFLAETLACVRTLDGQMSAPLVPQDRVELKFRDRLEVLDTISAMAGDQARRLEKVRARVEARDHALAAMTSYANRSLARAEEHLASAVRLDPGDWGDTEKLSELIVHYSNLLYQRYGTGEALAFLDELLGHLPSALVENRELGQISRANVHIFVVGLDHFQARRMRQARHHILKGLKCNPSMIKNRGVISMLLKTFLGSTRAESNQV